MEVGKNANITKNIIPLHFQNNFVCLQGFTYDETGVGSSPRNTSQRDFGSVINLKEALANVGAFLFGFIEIIVYTCGNG